MTFNNANTKGFDMADFISSTSIEETALYAEGELLAASRAEQEREEQLLHAHIVERIQMGFGQPHYEHDCDCIFDA